MMLPSHAGRQVWLLRRVRDRVARLGETRLRGGVASTHATAEAEEFIDRRKHPLLRLALVHGSFQLSRVGRDRAKPIAADRSRELVGRSRQGIPVSTLGLSLDGFDPVRHRHRQVLLAEGEKHSDPGKQELRVDRKYEAEAFISVAFVQGSCHRESEVDSFFKFRKVGLT